MKRFVVQLSRDMGKTWQDCCMAFVDGKIAMLSVQYFGRVAHHFSWRYLDRETKTPSQPIMGATEPAFL